MSSRSNGLVSPFAQFYYYTQRDAVKFVKKAFFGNKNIEAVKERLDRLTQDEARGAATETLKIVHGLVQNMRVVMDSEQAHSTSNPSSIECYPS
jgi:hypothetical protein